MILTGDSLELVPTLGLFDLIVTDPPFARDGRRAGRLSHSSRRTKRPRHLREYAMTSDVELIVAEAARHVRGGGRMVVVCGSSGRAVEAMLRAVTPTLPLARVLPWVKTSTMDGAVGPFGWQTTVALLFGKCGGLPRAQDYILTTSDRRRVRGPHPAEMPAAVGRWLARALAEPGMSVLDPFVGTGALLQGFAESGCEVTGIDVDARWAALARDRLAAVLAPAALPWSIEAS